MGATLKELAVKRSDIFYVDPARLSVKPGWNARAPDDPENAEHILSLARSIAEGGVREPLTVYKEGDAVYVSDGHCRLAATLYAIKKLGADIRAVPVKTEDRGADEADRVFSQIVRNSGKPLTPYEAGSVYKRLVAYGWTVRDIATKAGKSESAVNAALDLQGAPQEVRKLVASGKVSATLATETLRQEGPQAAVSTLHNAVDAATQKGKSRATRADIGKTPTTRLTPSGRLARLREIVDEAESDDQDGQTGLWFDVEAYKELLKLLEL